MGNVGAPGARGRKDLPAALGSSETWLNISALLGSRSISTSCAAPGPCSHSTPSTALPDAPRHREWICCTPCSRALTRRAVREWVSVIAMGHDPVHGPEREILVLIREGEEGHVDDFSHEDPLGAAFLFPVGDVGAAATPAGDPQGLDPRPGRVDSRRDGCVRRGRDLVRWARAWFGAVIDLVVSQVCKERCRRWARKRACRAHLSEVARAVRADRTGTFRPSSPRPR